MKNKKSTKNCTGCTACEHSCPVHAISMKRNTEGFFYPYIDKETCIQCGKCTNVCPIENRPKSYEGKECFAAYNKNEEQRMTSTSGGIFCLLAKQIIDNDGIVFGAAYTEDKQVKHKCITKMDDIYILQGAKYVQSELNAVFLELKKELIRGRKVLFSGTPCQIAGLKNFLERDYENLLTVDLVCHGVPSPLAWKAYLKYRKEEDQQIEIAENINVRSKISGWSNYTYSVEFRYRDGNLYHKISGEDPYMQAFVRNMILRESCGTCNFKGLARCSDFTLGDFWGIWNINPEMDDNKGVSLVIVHSKKGQGVWEKIQKDCIVLNVTEEDAYRENPSLIKASELSRKRKKILLKLSEKNFSTIIKELSKPNEYKIVTIIRCIKNMICKINKLYSKNYFNGGKRE